MHFSGAEVISNLLQKGQVGYPNDRSSRGTPCPSQERSGRVHQTWGHPVSDIWWWSLDHCSNMFIMFPKWCFPGIHYHLTYLMMHLMLRIHSTPTPFFQRRFRAVNMWASSGYYCTRYSSLIVFQRKVHAVAPVSPRDSLKRLKLLFFLSYLYLVKYHAEPLLLSKA